MKKKIYESWEGTCRRMKIYITGREVSTYEKNFIREGTCRQMKIYSTGRDVSSYEKISKLGRDVSSYENI